MTLKEFDEKYYLHDSSFIRLKKIPHTQQTIVDIDFCFWMQDWYDEKTHPKNGLIELDFYGVSQLKEESLEQTPFGISILDIEILEDNVVLFQLMGNQSGKYYEIKIQADGVQVKVLGK